MDLTDTVILVAYFFVLSILAIYGWHRYYLVYLYMKNKGNVPKPLPPVEALWPVTVQLPIFNEMYVADRLIDAVCEMDYPGELFEIQVLDDSTDETNEIAELAVRRHAARGVNIRYMHRVDRRGFKAGALEAGLAEASGRFIAIFDADFIPPADFLIRTLPYFEQDGLNLREERVVLVDVAPASLDHPDLFVLREVRQGPLEEVGRRNEIRVENGDEPA